MSYKRVKIVCWTNIIGIKNNISIHSEVRRAYLSDYLKFVKLGHLCKVESVVFYKLYIEGIQIP